MERTCVRAEPGTGLGILAETERSAICPSRSSRQLAARDRRPLPGGRPPRHHQDQPLVDGAPAGSPRLRRGQDHRTVGSHVGEARMVGLFTSKAFMEPASHVPILRRKLADIVANEDSDRGLARPQGSDPDLRGLLEARPLHVPRPRKSSDEKSWVCWHCRRPTRSACSFAATSWSGASRSSSPFLATGSMPTCARPCRISS